MVTVAIVHKCTILHSLMWVFFCSNCVKLATFFILHNYTSTDVIALKWKEEEEKDKSFVFDHENSHTKTTTFTANKDEFGSIPTSELGIDERGVR